MKQETNQRAIQGLVSRNNKQQVVHRLFEQQVVASPKAIALKFKHQVLSYAQLNSRANALSRKLLELNVKPGDIVALAMSHSIEVIVANLAVLKCGAGYLPLDAKNPVKRNQDCLDDSKVKVILTDTRLDVQLTDNRVCISTIDNCELFEAEELANLSLDFDPENIAYVMFTSGSSGKPKGVVVPHRAIARLVIDTNYIDISPHDNVFGFAPLSFDASTLEVWGALLNGATLVLYSGESLDPNLFAKELQENQVTILWLTAALFQLIASRYISALSTVKNLLAGGDVINPKMVSRVFEHYPDITVINGYGPTENTTFTCCHRMSASSKLSDTIPIGTAITGTNIHILDEQLQPVAKGESGELYTSGLGVALGYIGQSSKSGAFFTNPDIANGMIYRTGDLVRLNQADEVEFIGRKDNQVKIRGFRASLEEIENNLLANDYINGAVVALNKFECGDQQLVAHLQLQDKVKIDSKEIKKRLSFELPKYMVPDLIHVEKLMPITKNGKIDRSKVLSSQF